MMLATFLFSDVVFADSSSDFLVIPLVSDLSSSTICTQGVYIGTLNNIDYYAGKTVSKDFYIGAFKDYGNPSLCIISSDSNLDTSTVRIASSDGSVYGSYGMNTIDGIRFGTKNIVTSSFSLNCYYYLSSSAMVSAFKTWTPPTPTPVVTYNYTLQNGWLSVIDFGSSGVSYDLALNTSFAEYSHLSQPWWDSTHRYWFTDTMPIVGTTITNSETGNLISWEKTGNTDLFGRSKMAVANISGTTLDRYLIIYNPAYHTFNGFGTGPRDESNLPLNISGIPQGANITLFKMDETMHLINGITSQFISDAGSTIATGSALNVTDTFVDSDGNSVIQNSGGGNDIHESSGIVSYIVSINDTLDNFTNQFIQLLSAPIVHIQQLIQSGSNFFSVFIHIFDWLGPELSGLVYGAFVIFLIIGVLKLLL